MARTAKKTKAVTVATAEHAATDAEIRSVGEVAADVVAALPAPEPDPDPDMTVEAETVAGMASVAAEPANAPEAETVAEPATGAEIFNPINKLKKSPRNARKTPHSEAHIEALAASIAAKGILQNLVVEPEANEAGETTGFYFVTIGEGRRLAQLLRVKRKEIKKTEPIRCVLDTANDPQEISLDENVTRANMHPADEFEAFRELADNRGWGAEEIAARFGVSAHVVKQRLRLGAVSPKLMQVYREGDLTLDQLMAFAITDDHARQEQVFENLHYNKDPSIIRRDLIRTHVQANDRKAVFVGPAAYTEAGGTIIRDLFTEDRGGYYDDPALLDRLVLEKLEGIAADIQGEGWKWAEFSIDFPYAHGMSRFYPHALELSEEDLPADVDQRFAELEAEMERIDDRREGYEPDHVTRGGVFVTLNHDGTARIERGFVRPEDEAPEPEAEEGADGETVIDGVRVNADGEIIEGGSSPDPDSDGDEEHDEEPEGDAGQPVSDILTRDLTAHRMLGLRLALGEQPETALIAVTYALAAQTFYLGANAHTLEIRPTKAHLGDHAGGIEDTAAAKMLADRHAGWASDMPQNVADLWDFIAGLDHASIMVLFAHCASLTVNALKLPWEHKRRAYETADKLATALALDMSQYWTPTVSSYLGPVTKAHILEAAHPAGEGQWIIDDKAEATLREMGERGDIIKCIHRGLTESGIERAASDYVLAGEMTEGIVGRLVARGLDDELAGSAFAVIDGIDGRTHHIRLPDLDAAGDSAPGSIVELRSYEDRSGRRRMALAVRSDLSIEGQIHADGSTWLDRQLVGNASAELADGGFGGEVKAALEARTERLVEEGLASHGEDGRAFRRNLLTTLRRRELERVAGNLSTETGLPWKQTEAGEHVSGIYRQRVTLAFGRFAMIDDGMGFQLVPWSPSVEQHLGRQVSGIARGGGGVDWSFGRKRGIGL